MKQGHYYTDEKNAQILIALLKAHGIRKVIANPGTTNIAFVGSVQNDPWFQVYSGVDERHSAYMAVGMAAESGEPVVLSCTGATASRNYLPALTEAYYRKVPVLAVTSMQNFDNVGQLSPQAIDRERAPNDAVVKSVMVRTVNDAHDIHVCERVVNEAILALKRRGGGPVHINLEMGGCMTFNSETLPEYKKIERITNDGVTSLSPEIRCEKIVLFVGSGACSQAWKRFVEHYDAVAVVDCGSRYDGPNKVYASLLCSQIGFRSNPKYRDLKPDLIIDVGEVCGDYPTLGYFGGLAPVWRVSADGEIRSRFGNPDCVFEMSEEAFVGYFCAAEGRQNSTYSKLWQEADSALRKRIPQLPFSNPWIAKELSALVPDGSVLHLGILNSLRSWNLFPPVNAVSTFSNVGGFGIDGGLSTLIGASLACPDKLCFGVFGDLSFFYDLNSLGNRYVGKNLRILLVNNGCGMEFNMYFHPGSQFGSQTNDFIAAGGHFGGKSKQLVHHYATDLGFKYLTASSAEEFRAVVDEFLSPVCDQSIVFECFTNPEDESSVHRILQEIEPYHSRQTLAGAVKGAVPARVKNAVKAFFG